MVFEIFIHYEQCILVVFGRRKCDNGLWAVARYKVVYLLINSGGLAETVNCQFIF